MAVYYFLMGALFAFLGDIAPQPAGTILLGAFFVVLFATGAVVVWRRTAMRLLAISWILAGAWFAAAAALAIAQRSGYNHGLNSAPWPFIVPIPFIVLLGFSERWVHPDQWQSFKEHQGRCTWRNMLTLRNIPDLRAH